jgi:hypothetical protein
MTLFLCSLFDRYFILCLWMQNVVLWPAAVIYDRDKVFSYVLLRDIIIAHNS